MMIRQLDLDDLHEVLEVLYLQQKAYRVEAELIGFEEIPPLMDTPQSIKQSRETFFGCFRNDKLAGAVACKQEAKELIISRMMVDPAYFRQGIASRLLQHVENLALPGMRLQVSTGIRNIPAIRLYEKHGFEAYREMEIAPGIILTMLQKIV